MLYSALNVDCHPLVSDFYTYAKRFMRTSKQQCLLSDIVPVAPTAPNVAAQAFYREFSISKEFGGTLLRAMAFRHAHARQQRAVEDCPGRSVWGGTYTASRQGLSVN